MEKLVSELSLKLNLHVRSSMGASQGPLFCFRSATDWRFAITREGSNVPFATAGDCYSAVACPQVRKTTEQTGLLMQRRCG